MSALSWSELCERPELQDLPFKIETDDEGHIIMTPTKNYRGFFQAEIAARLRAYPGKVITEGAVWTPKGTKVPDVAWMTEATFEIIKYEAECSVCAPSSVLKSCRTATRQPSGTASASSTSSKALTRYGNAQRTER